MDRFDAFISYAHEDAATAEWLAKLLEGYWVPGKKRRRIFLDKHNLAAGDLDEEIKRNLRDSRFLVVCCSRSARTSDWVDKEVTEFAAWHDKANILGCRVGDPADDELPLSIKGRGLFLPDLRGQPGPEEAVALLPKIVGVADKEEITARRKKRKTIMIAAATAFSVMAIAGLVARMFWLQTPDGVHYLMLRHVLAAAERGQVFDDTQVIQTAEAVAKTDSIDAARTVALLMHEEPFRTVALAGAELSLPHPDCSAAERELRNVKLHQSLPQWDAVIGRPFLLTQSRCGVRWIDQVRPTTLVEVGSAGLADDLRRLEKTQGMSEERIKAEVALAAAIGRPIAVSASDLRRWEPTASYEVIRILEQIEDCGLARDSGAAIIASFALQTIHQHESLDPWKELNIIAGVFAANGRAADARAVLAEAERLPQIKTDDDKNSSGWSWNALAWNRLGNTARANAAFQRARACARTDMTGANLYSEWLDLVHAYAASGDWKRAFDTAESFSNEDLRIHELCILLEAWSHRG